MKERRITALNTLIQPYAAGSKLDHDPVRISREGVYKHARESSYLLP
jgi:hypothetical protein